MVIFYLKLLDITTYDTSMVAKVQYDGTLRKGDIFLTAQPMLIIFLPKFLILMNCSIKL